MSGTEHNNMVKSTPPVFFSSVPYSFQPRAESALCGEYPHPRYQPQLGTRARPFVTST